MYKDIVFFTPERLIELFGWIETILKTASPSVLIYVALSMLGSFFGIVIYAFKKGANRDDGNEDFDIKHLD